MRTGLAAILLLLFIPVAILADLSVWATRTVVDERAFTATVTDALDAPAFHEAVAGVAADTLTDRIEGLDPTVRAAGAAAIGISNDRTAIHTWLDDRLVTIMESDGLRVQRDALIGAAHHVLVDGADSTGPVRIVGDNVIVDVGGVETVIATALDPTGVAAQFLQFSPAEQQVVVAQAIELDRVTSTIRRLRTLLPILALAMAVIGLLVIVFAHHRARAIGGIGAALVFAGGIGVGIAWLAGQVVGAFVHAPLVRDAVSEIVASLSGVLMTQSALLVVAGVAFMIAGWSIGREQHRQAVAAMFDPV
jgi:hypothetical protein